MRITKWLGSVGRLALAGAMAGAMAMTTARAQDDDRGPPDREPPPRRRGDDRDRERPRREPRPRYTDSERMPLGEGEYFIGLACASVPGPLRAQLDLPEGQGLLVSQVFPSSPADRAGIKHNDVLSTADGKPLKNSRDLAEIVQAAKGKEIKIELIRGAKPMSVAVTPAKRPDKLTGGPAERGRGMPEIDRLYDLFDREGNPLRFRFFHPGMLLPPGASARPPFPDDLTVKITKHGNKPAEIEVNQGDKSWKATEDKLDELPAAVRGHVAGLLGRPFLGDKFRIQVLGPDEGRGDQRGPPDRPDGPPRERRGGPARDEAPAFGRGGPPDEPGGDRPERPRRPGRGDGPEFGRGGPPDGPPGERRRGSGREDGRGVGRGAAPDGPGRERFDGRIEQRLDEMSRHLQELREELNELRPRRRSQEPRPRPPEVEPGEPEQQP